CFVPSIWTIVLTPSSTPKPTFELDVAPAGSPVIAMIAYREPAPTPAGTLTWTVSLAVSPGLTESVAGDTEIIVRAENGLVSWSPETALKLPSVACASPRLATVRSSAAAARRVNWVLAVVPGFAVMLMIDGWIESISFPDGPLGAEPVVGDGEAACTGP